MAAMGLGKTEHLTGIAAKAARAADEVLAGRRQTQAALVREALLRTTLTTALNEALAGRADALRRVAEMAAYDYRARARKLPLRRRGRPVRLLERVLGRLGPPGEALVIARAGVWQGTGRPWRDAVSILGYALRGPKPQNQPDALFAQAWYLETYPDARRSRRTPLAHYLLAGAAAGYSPHPCFDAGNYVAEDAGVLAAHGISPLEHFARRGAAEGRSIHALFDVGHYLAQRPAIEPGEEAVLHYMSRGWRDGLSPHPLFDPDWYLAQGPVEPDVSPLAHYSSVGWKEGRSPHPLFDPAWYLEANPDVAAEGIDPLRHFIEAGWRQGRNPSPWFDVAFYREQRGERLPATVNPLVDYLQGGAWEGADVRPGFSTTAYLAESPHFARTGMTPLEYWARKNAGRLD